MIHRKKINILILIIASIFLFSNVVNSAMGPLIKIPGKHYFQNSANGKFVYLTGSHTWNNLQDEGFSYPPPPFDFDSHLNWLDMHGHNFIRFWVFEQAKWKPNSTDKIWFNPNPYSRTGAKNDLALDGKPKFDLKSFNQDYFNRLRNRIIAARDRGFYVSIMFFQGWSIFSGKKRGKKNPWEGHPFNKSNNINGIDGDFFNNNEEGEEFHSTLSATIMDYQKTYIREVIDTVNDLDNVIYEIANEDPGWNSFWAEKHIEWQYELINYIKSYESKNDRIKHPVGMTAIGSYYNNSPLWNSPADWISPGLLNRKFTCPDEAYRVNPPVPSTKKVILLDTDHLWGVGGDRKWVWKAFLRGYNPIYMDTLQDIRKKTRKVCNDSKQIIKKVITYDLINIRKNMGYTSAYAKRANISDMIPRNGLSSTDYCLAKEGEKYIIYQPSTSAPITIYSLPNGEYSVETLDLKDGSIEHISSLQWSGEDLSLDKPTHVKEDWVVFIKNKSR